MMGIVGASEILYPVEIAFWAMIRKPMLFEIAKSESDPFDDSRGIVVHLLLLGRLGGLMWGLGLFNGVLRSGMFMPGSCNHALASLPLPSLVNDCSCNCSCSCNGAIGEPDEILIGRPGASQENSKFPSSIGVSS